MKFWHEIKLRLWVIAASVIIFVLIAGILVVPLLLALISWLFISLISEIVFEGTVLAYLWAFLLITFLLVIISFSVYAFICVARSIKRDINLSKNFHSLNVRCAIMRCALWS